jgi:FkbM family methyltransferase
MARGVQLIKKAMMIFAALSDKLAEVGVAGTTTAIHNKVVRVVKKIVIAIFPSLGPNFYLKQVRGIIHVGANLGQERELYAKYKLKVLWIEPLPQIFEQLCKNVRPLPDQTAVNRLIADRDNAQYLFHVASNEGASSSILELARHHEIWPDVRYVSKIMLNSITLDSLLKNLGDGIPYDALVMDTQGSELLVLKGATNSLGQFKFIKTEAADFEAYKDCARVKDLTSYLAQFGFKLIRSDKFAESPKGGRYFDLIFANSAYR